MSNIVFGRTKVRRVLQTTLAVALVGGVVTTLDSPAVAAPEKVLQSVAISLGSDSSIRSIDSTAVRAGEDESLTSDSEGLDPSAVAGDLPVRVQTSYRLGERTGTDLSDIEGEAGRVVIDVTVQNVTARPETVAYDFDGAVREQNALVATPLTVVASADLGEGAFGTVVTQDDVEPDAVTNGVLGRSEGRSADVQWAALLAPPRLGASATFRLVQDTQDFSVPSFDLSVQPGLVTDPSVQQLLEAAFSEDPSSTLKLETSTIELVSSVNGILTTASSVLAQIQGELGSSAEVLGQKTIADLESSASLVSSSLSSLAGDVDALSSQMSSEMQRASGDTVAQFQETVGRMQELLGDPRAFDRLPTVKEASCERGLPPLTTRGSITEQMLAITAHLGAISTATADCGERLKAGLVTAVGDEDATAGDGSVIGSVMQTQETLVQQAGQLRAKGQEIAGIFDSNLLNGASRGVATLQTGMFGSPDDDRDGLHGIANRLRGGSSELQQDLEDILEAVDALLVEEGALGDLAALRAQLVSLETAAREADARLSTEDNDKARSLILDDIRPQVCATDTDAAVLDEPSDELSIDLVGVPCGVALDGDEAAAEQADDLLDRVDASGLRISDAAAKLDAVVGNASAAVRATDDLRRELDQVRRSLFLLQDYPTREIIAELQAQMPAISEGTVTERDCAFVRDPAQVFEPELTPEETRTDAVEAIVCNYGALYENQKDIDDTEILRIFEDSALSLGTLKDDLGGDVEDIRAEREDAEQQVDDVVATLSTALTQSVDSIRTQGQKSVKAQRDQLESEERKLAAGLEQRITEAVRRIEGTVSDSNRNLVAAERALVADLDEVLLDLGTRDEDGSGLLGALAKGAADTGTATDSVVRASTATSEFAGVRSTALGDVFLQQAQLEASLEMLQRFPAFGVELPEGSSHLTVFTYEIGGS